MKMAKKKKIYKLVMTTQRKQKWTDKCKYGWFVLNGISTLVGYLMINLVYLYMYVCMYGLSEKKLDGNWTRMLRVILNKSWKQHPTKHHLYGHLPPISKTIQIRQTRHARNCWRNRNKLMFSYGPLRHERVSVERPTRTYLQQLSLDTGCSLEDQPEVRDDREEWREREREIETGKSMLAAQHDDDVEV